jgi:hypothetical protein
MSSASAGRELLQALKRAAGSPGPSLCLPVGNPARALLRPVPTRPHLLNAADVRNLTEWRNKFVQSFLSEFEATTAQTSRWLTDVAGPSDTKILFMADHLDGRTFGYMGLAYIDWEKTYGEADAIVRGGDAPPGTMSAGLRSLLRWARGSLGLRNLAVRVLSDNPALEFYRKFGFQEQRRTPLVVEEQPAKKVWVEAPAGTAADRYLVHLVLPPGALEEEK